MNSYIDLLISDCDGVIVDSEIIVERLRREVLGERFPLQELDILLAGTFGLQSHDILARVEAHFGVELPETFHTELRQRSEAATLRDAAPIAGVREALQAIDLPLAVVSNSRRASVEHALQRAGLSERVSSGVFAAEDVQRPKPAPDLYLLAAKRAGVEPSRCLVVEDSATGATAALTAGMRVIGFLGASHIPPEHGEVLRELGVEALLKDMRELPALVELLRGEPPRQV
jgi:HAD superfamily hydrolase (TIGR01509 family)